MKQLRGTDLKRLHRDWRRANESRLSMVLETVQSPFNVGAIVRSSAAMGVDRLYLAGQVPAVRSAPVQKTALGTDRYLTVEHFETIEEAIAAAKGNGSRVVGIELADESKPLFAVDLVPDVALVLGHEDRGLTQTCLDLCDDVAFIPQLGRVGSLNVSSAATVALYEARRQGYAASGTPPQPDAAD